QHVVIRAVAHLRAGDQAQAAEVLTRSLADERLAPFHEGVLRVFGEAAEREADQSWKRHRKLRAVLGIGGTGPSTPARLPDALVAAWRTRTAAPVGTGGGSRPARPRSARRPRSSHRAPSPGSWRG